jgi:photosystem II stability/assembly factor-like uncharacterized protein
MKSLRPFAFALALPVLALWSALPASAAPAPAKAGKAAAKDDSKKKDEGPMSTATFAGLAFRSIGPALTSGRVIDLAVDPSDARVWWVAAASGGLWRTDNAGTTWSPVFDDQGSYSIGAVAIDPSNPSVVWVGTGEKNSQRSVSYGDGVYRTLDAGKTWKNVGLGKSEHIGRILVDPRDSKVVYVAAQGPLWNSGGDRGLYKTTDAGATWKQVLKISDDTGVSDVVFDPRDPDVLYASAYQRRRHVWTLIDGGPEGGIYKSTDAGATWRKLETGLPKHDVGRVGLAVSPVDPDIVYALVEAEGDEGGFYRSADRGESWEKRSDYNSSSAQYYQVIVADPTQLDRVYSMDTLMKVSNDGGKTFSNLGEKSKHVDNHVLWVDPANTRHYLAGCDGGLYESFDRGASWRYFENLPITQFYRVAVDDAWPVYDVCGGTQDNNSMCGPSRTLRFQGPANEDWFITQGGDGFWTAADPKNPDLVYAEAQYGALTRFDRKSGENIDIQPQPGADEAPFRWNWDSPLVVSSHAPTRIYFAANKLFRSDDRGDTWSEISPDLTRQIDRNQLEIFGRIQRPEAVAKNDSTSFYGTIVSLAESPGVDGLLYAGTDDGLIQVTEDGGAHWRRIESFPGVPDRSYVSRLVASRHDPNVVYAAFDNHKQGDFRPYVLRSGDRGRTWSSISGDLPERGTVYALLEDSVDRDLVFAGTEFGVYFTEDGGRKWVRLSGGLPTIAVRDLALQEREGDLVLGTFGRGFYVLDDISPLRSVDAQKLESSKALLFAPRKAWLYVPGSRIGDREKGSMGETFYTADNPPFGVQIAYYLKDEWKSKKDQRVEAERKLQKEGKQIQFPSFDSLRQESREEPARLVLTIRDEDGSVVRRIEAKPEKGIHRLVWDLRYPPSNPARTTPPPPNPYLPPPQGPLVAPGSYTAGLELIADGEVQKIGDPVPVVVDVLANATLPAKNRAAVLAFQRKTARLQRAVLGAEKLIGELSDRLKLVRAAIAQTPTLDPSVDAEAHGLELELDDLSIAVSGDEFLRKQNENTPPSLTERVQNVVYSSWYSTAEPTTTQLDAYRIAGDAFTGELAKLKSLAEEKLPALERKLELAGAPWTPGRVPDWKLEP